MTKEFGAIPAFGPSDPSHSTVSRPFGFNPSDLLSLANECEQAKACDQHDLLRSAFKLVFGGPECIPIDHWPGYKSPRWDRFHLMLNAEAYLNAAITLVPDDYVWIAGLGVDRKPIASVEFGHQRTAATTALALCAAVLRAMAA